MTVDEPRSGLTRAEVGDIVWLANYWEHMAISPPGRIWKMGGWSWLPWLGDDERKRRTLVWGRWVLALWYCRCKDCRMDRLRLEALIDS